MSFPQPDTREPRSLKIMVDPLIAVCMSFTKNVAPRLTPQKYDQVSAIVTRFICGELNFLDCKRLYAEIVGSCEPIEKIQEILTLPDTPIPDGYFNSDESPSSNRRKKTRPWESAEDMRLLAGVHRFGFESWANVARFVGSGRTRSQCSQRWCRVLDPKISQEAWTKEETNRLLELIQRYGVKSWIKVAAEMKNRSDVQCRYHYIQLQREGRALPLTPKEQKEGVPGSDVAPIPRPVPAHPGPQFPPISQLTHVPPLPLPPIQLVTQMAPVPELPQITQVPLVQQLVQVPQIPQVPPQPARPVQPPQGGLSLDAMLAQLPPVGMLVDGQNVRPDVPPLLMFGTQPLDGQPRPPEGAEGGDVGRIRLDGHSEFFDSTMFQSQVFYD